MLQLTALDFQILAVPIGCRRPAASLRLLFQPPRIRKEITHLLPYGGFQELTSDLGVAADSFAPKPIAIGSAATVITEILQAMASASLVGRLAVVRVAAYCTAGEPL